MKRLVLASGSVYRRTLLERLGVPFDVAEPRVDETARPDEPPASLARRLAESKARAVEAPESVVIGSDQVPSLHGAILRKPGSHAVALAQLLRCQGEAVRFDTAVFVHDRGTDQSWATVDVTEVVFARRGRAELDAYLVREQPYDCAGGFKAEGLGIALFDEIRSSDPTALIGLPLIWVAKCLREAGLDPLAPGVARAMR
jgi:septum formation protein